MNKRKDPKADALKRQFALNKPCSQCPFRNDDQAIALDPGRRQEIIQSLLTGQAPTFHCHKTVYRSDNRNHDDDGNYRPIDVQHCPGAIAVVQKAGGQTTAVQLAERFGIIQTDHYEAANPLTLNPESL